MRKYNKNWRNSRAKLNREILREIAAKLRPTDYFVPIDHPELRQAAFLVDEHKNISAFGGNRSSKTESGAVRVTKSFINTPDIRILCATWADLSVTVQQRKIYNCLPKDGTIQPFSYTNKRGFGSRIVEGLEGQLMKFKTYDQGWESFQGEDWDIIWLDEEAPEDVLKECKARLIDRDGVLIRTMTPLKGITYTHDEVVLNANNDPEISYYYFNAEHNPHINQEARARIIDSYAPKEAEVRTRGIFANLTSGTSYYAFSEENIIEEDQFTYVSYHPLEISCDFNVDLMSWGIGQEAYGRDYLFDFVELEGQANTDLMCQMLKNEYVHHTGGWIFYGDIAGSQRHPESSKTNWAIIREHFPDAEIYYQNIKNLKDRIDATNARLRNARKTEDHPEGEIKYFITRNCARHIKDYRQVTWEMLLNKNKAGKLTHASDGESYKFFWKYPLTGKTTVEQRRIH